MRKTPISDPIASLELLLVAPDGAEVPVSAKVGRPYRAGGSAWACPCALEGIDGMYPDIFGEGSVQSLALALALVRQRLGQS